jgi:hypothetical protein
MASEKAALLAKKEAERAELFKEYTRLGKTLEESRRDKVAILRQQREIALAQAERAKEARLDMIRERGLGNSSAAQLKRAVVALSKAKAAAAHADELFAKHQISQGQVAQAYEALAKAKQRVKEARLKLKG